MSCRCVFPETGQSEFRKAIAFLYFSMRLIRRFSSLSSSGGGDDLTWGNGSTIWSISLFFRISPMTASPIHGRWKPTEWRSRISFPLAGFRLFCLRVKRRCAVPFRVWKSCAGVRPSPHQDSRTVPVSYSSESAIKNSLLCCVSGTRIGLI